MTEVHFLKQKTKKRIEELSNSKNMLYVLDVSKFNDDDFIVGNSETFLASDYNLMTDIMLKLGLN